MSGAGSGSVNSILQQASGILASLPDVLVYGIGALVVVFAATALLALDWPARNKPATTVGRPTSSCSTTSSNSHTDSSSGSKPTEEPVPQEQSPDTPPKSTSPSTPSEADPQHQPTQPTSQAQPGVNNAVSEQPERDPVAVEKSRTVNRNYTASPKRWQQHRSTRNNADSPTLATQLRRHLTDPVQIETGIDLIGWDSSWGLIKADFSLTGVSADTGGELVYFNVFPSPVSYKTSNSPIEITTTSLIRRLLGTAGSSSSPDQQSTARHSAVSTQRQHHTTQSDHNTAERQTRTHLYDRELEDPAPSLTEASPNPEPQSAPPIQDSSPQFSTQAETQNLLPPDTSGEHSHTGVTRRKQTDNPATDKSMTAAEPFDSSDFSMTETSDTNPPLGIPTEHQVFKPLRNAQPTPAINEAAAQNDQQTAHRTEPFVDQPMQSEMYSQFGLHSLARNDERRPGEATLNAALPGNDLAAPFEDIEYGLDGIGIDSTQFRFDAPDEPQNSWPETEPLEPFNDPFGVSDAADHFDDTELFPNVTFDDPLTGAYDDLEDFEEPSFDTGIRF